MAVKGGWQPPDLCDSLYLARRLQAPERIRRTLMKRAVVLAWIAAGFLGLTCVSFRPVLFQDKQFAFRDAGFFYYPLYQRVQQEWEAGRWPLWEPEENGGVPLLGNPTAVVLYPGKIVYAFSSYAWGTRLYVIAHV